MKIIGRTETGARLVEMEMEEMIALINAAQALKRFSLCCPIIKESAPEIMSVLPPAIEPVARHSVARSKKRRRASAAPTKKTQDRHKTCAVCSKGFLDKSPSNKRIICTKIACKKEWKRRANVKYRESHSGKPGKEVACLKAAIQPANLGLTPEQMAQRQAEIKKIVEKHKYD